jgi:hypothetical protein
MIGGTRMMGPFTVSDKFCSEVSDKLAASILKVTYFGSDVKPPYKAEHTIYLPLHRFYSKEGGITYIRLTHR